MERFKKLSALILALALVLGLGTAALADEAAEEAAAAGYEEAATAAEEEEAEAGYVEIVAIAEVDAVEETVAVPLIVADLVAGFRDVVSGLVVVPDPLVTDFAGGTLPQPNSVLSIVASVVQAHEEGALVALANWRNPAAISLVDMNALATVAGDTPLIINADTFPFLSSEADVRIVFSPALATKDIELYGTTRSVTVRVVRRIFENAFGGTASVISLAHQGEFGMEVRVAARVDESFTADAVYFYTYNLEAHTISQFVPSFVWLDAYGYLHFTTAVGGEIIVSDVNLAPAAPVVEEAAPAPAPAPAAPAADEVEDDEEDEDDDEDEEEEDEE